MRTVSACQCWWRSTGAADQDLGALQRRLGKVLPADYRALLLWSNGGVWQIGDHPFYLWGLEELAELNQDYEIGVWLPGILAIGTDGGGKCYALDYRGREDSPSFVQVPLGALCPEEILVQGSSLAASFRRWIGLDDARARLLRCLASRVAPSGRHALVPASLR